MTCPKDVKTIEEIDGKWYEGTCAHKIKYPKGKRNSIGTQAICTRPKNHNGKHHEHSKKGCIITWTTEEEIIEAL